MSSQSKADAFAAEAAKHDWETEQKTPFAEEVHVWARRKGEEIYIWWRDDKLIETPKYVYAGVQSSLHNKATATRQLSLKPDAAKAARRAPKRTSAEIADVPIIAHLPFDIWEDPDGKILKEIRGATIVWRNGMTGEVESAHVVRELNYDLRMFNLQESSDGKPFVNFRDLYGFRAVHLEAILDVR